MRESVRPSVTLRFPRTHRIQAVVAGDVVHTSLRVQVPFQSAIMAPTIEPRSSGARVVSYTSIYSNEAHVEGGVHRVYPRGTLLSPSCDFGLH